ncbi:MAG TPA: hypothetical protein VK508_12770 [Cyclobacteriaceae bacterium]|nr:hypothetical protein [Cyclobacteriaceae bacterium]
METNQTNILDQDFSVKTIRRRQLLPWWIKTFSWLFMIAGAFVPCALAAALLFGFTYHTALYGLETFEPLSPIGIILAGMYLLKGAVGFGLWFEKDWAIIAGLIDCIIGILACLCVMLVFPRIEGLSGYSTSFRLEILFLIFFMVKLVRIRRQWMGE